jgi:hypothetical protein
LPSTSDVIHQYSILMKCYVYGIVPTHFPSEMWTNI